MKIIILIIVLILFLPFYVYVLNKSAMLGKLVIIKKFISKEVNNGKEDESQE